MEPTTIRVSWPVADARTYESRPASLVRELEALGLFQVGTYERHGRGAGATPLSELLFDRSAEAVPTAILSPFFLPARLQSAFWIDLYDDWGRAPEMSRPAKAMARRGFRALRRAHTRGLSAPVTTNSVYMRDKFAELRPRVVPNGVDPSLATISTDPTAEPALVFIGNFFPGRTDWGLLREMALSTSRPKRFYGLTEAQIERLRGTLGGASDVELHPKTPLEVLASSLGSESVIAIPHVVNDYTMSQDLMKAYQAVALGHRVLLPLELVPPSVPLEFCTVISPGVEITALVEGSFRGAFPTSPERASFADSNSWRSRAEQIGSLIHGL